MNGEKRRWGRGFSLRGRKQKALRIHTALTSDPIDMEILREEAGSEGGFLQQEIRRKAWPKLLNINILPPKPGPASLTNHRDYRQVEMDVRRSLRRFPKGMAEGERSVLQGQLTDMILYVLKKNPELHYYQGYHDVAVTLLLTTGVRMATAILETLSTHHLRDFMDQSVDRTRLVLGYLMPLVQLESARLHDFLLRSEVGCIFALSWLVTWYGHVLCDFHQVLRLYDFFLASHPLMPVYCAAQMVLMRGEEILRCDCDMPSIHQLLSTIPPNFPYETLISRTHAFFQKHPPCDLGRHASLHSIPQISSSQDCGNLLVLQRNPLGSGDPLRRSGNTLVKLAVWGLSASLGAAALAVTHSALEWGPEMLLGLF